jgi:twinkle protein
MVSQGPCPACGSSDANTLYEDGHTHCYSCEAHSSSKGQTRSKSGLPQLTYGPLKVRRIREDTCRKYWYGFNANGEQTATYFDASGKPVAHKTRTPAKTFSWKGDAKGSVLFGQQLFREGGKRVVVTEGELDALSLSQAMGNKWPVVSVKNGAGGALRDIKANLEWLESYEIVVFMFDMDTPGREAALKCAEVLTPGKARIAQLPLKDANEMLVANRVEELLGAFWEAKTYRPSGLLSGADALERVLSHDEAEYLRYPWPGLNKLTRGARSSSIMTVCAGSGIGKSEFVREVGHHVLKQGLGLGYIALEETVRRTAQGLLSTHLQKPLHLLEGQVEHDEIRQAAQDLGFNRDNVVFFDHFGSLQNETLMSKIRYMAVSLGIRWVILDHVSIVVSGQQNENERIAIDYLMTEIRSLCQETGVGMFLVSHLKRPPGDARQWEEGRKPRMADLRGSAAIEQLSDYIFGLSRNMRAEGPERNQLHVDVLKNRHTGEMGHACALRYDIDKSRLLGAEEFEDDLVETEGGF